MIGLQTLVPTLVTFALGLLLYLGLGRYDEKTLWLITAVLIFGIGVHFLRGRFTRIQIPVSWFSKAVWLLVAIQIYYLTDHTHLIYVDNPGAATWLVGLLKLSLIIWIASVFFKDQYIAGSGVVALVIAKLLVIFTSTHPRIDVFIWVSQAVDEFLKFHNPYTAVYPDLFGSKQFYGYPPVFAYWPGLIYFLAPFRLLNLDMRVALWAADLVTSVLIFRMAKEKFKSTQLALSFAVLWLSLTVSFFVLEQAWVDSVLVLLAVALVYFFKSKKLTGLALVCGFALSVKQYALFFVWFAFCEHIARAAPNREKVISSLKVAGCGILVFCLIVLPFALVDFNAFYFSTVEVFKSMWPRADALTFHSYFMLSQNPSMVSFLESPLITLLFLALATLFCFLGAKNAKENENHGTYFLISAFCFYSFLFLFGQHSFCNQYYFLTIWPILIALQFGPQPKTT